MSAQPKSGGSRSLLLPIIFWISLLSCGANRRPDVLLIIVDTLRADHLGIYGYERDTSPNIDALAQRSVVFRNALTPAPWTNPAIAAVLSGLHPGALGIANRPAVLPPELQLLPEVLSADGYGTHGIVSHLMVLRKLGFAQGFDTWSEDQSQSKAHVSSKNITDQAIEILRSQAPDRPFFLFLHYFDPHYEYKEHAGFEFSTNYDGKLRGHSGISETRKLAASGDLTESDIQYLRDLYDSEIRFTDAQIGRVLDEIARLNRFDGSLIIFTSDHGEAFAKRADRWIGHTKTLYQELLHVPLVIKLPDSRSQRIVDVPVSTVNIFPTVTEILGIHPPQTLGVATRSLLSEDGNTPVFSETRYRAILQSVDLGRWKLIHDSQTGIQYLFDLNSDPNEEHNLASRLPNVVTKLDALRLGWDKNNRLVQSTSQKRDGKFSDDEIERLRQLGYAQ